MGRAAASGPRRLGFVVGLPWEEPGGVQTVTHLLVQAAAREGHEVHVLALGSPGAKTVERWERGACLRLLDSNEHARDFDSLNLSASREQDVLDWCRDHDLEYLHLQHLSAFGLGLPPRLRSRGIPFTWTLHDYHPWCPRGQMWSVDGEVCPAPEVERCGDCWARTWPQLGTEGDARESVARRQELAARALESCEDLRTPTPGSRRVALACGAPEEFIRVHGNPLPHSPWTPEPRVLDPEHVHVGVLGSIQPSKGVLELAEWIADLGDPFHLEVHGPLSDYHGDRSYGEAFLDLVRREERVVWHGPFRAAALPLIFSDLDLVCVPSLWNEVFGLAAHGANAAGRPLFVSDRGGLVDGPGVQLPAGDGEAWKAALLRFVREPHWRESVTPAAPQS